MKSRRQNALEIRTAAAGLAATRPHPTHYSNGDEGRFRFEDITADTDPRHGNAPTYIGNFTKCLPHDADGFLIDPADYSSWVRAIDSGDPRDFYRLRIGPGPFAADGDFQYTNPLDPNSQPIHGWAHTYSAGEEPGVRAWESQGAGSTYDLEGPDAQAVTMPPCPSLDSQELIAEMAEVYWMAVCRDIPFADWGSHPDIDTTRDSLKRLWWFRADRTGQLNGVTDRLPTSLARRRILSEDGVAPVPLAQLFRGVTPGEQLGPYISQFLLIGNTGIAGAQAITDGQVAYGAIQVNQRVRVATEDNYMQNWNEWLDVQNGADVRGRENYDTGYRFICKPRDMATYVHHDALYEAYLNACLILLGLGAPFDPGLPFQRADYRDKQQGFAQFGGPHILTLVTEVATRALKAVRYQKFNVHRRLRPEAVGGWMYQRRNGNNTIKDRLAVLANMEAAYAGSSQVGAAVETVNNNTPNNWLLPMAFQEGSPTHPSYGAGHATVAGACVTMLKAWFDHGWELKSGNSRIVFEADATGAMLNDVSGIYPSDTLTVQGELNKLAANISIGRDWAGVHFYTDYYESWRMGEQIALGILEEQKLSYGENFSLTVPLLDGTTVRI